MKSRNLLAAILAAVIGYGCSGSTDTTKASALQAGTLIEGDATIYGLACDGCNDTIIIFLRTPYDGSDPDTLNVLEASRKQHVMGIPRIGDQLAIVLNKRDSTVADLVIVTQDLQAEWCYRVWPTLRQRADREATDVPDSVLQLLAIDREYGIELKNQGTARSIGMAYDSQTSDEEPPVEYPALIHYNEWHIFNGQLILQSTQRDSLDQTTLVTSDTATIELLQPDSLVLRFADRVQGYYKRVEDEVPDSTRDN